ncbi:MAG: pimelyl-ACP methyl ester esterase [Legionella sp.]|nr:MAG: pimelyl-ACP methyl ester esterase [Legionella sp.]
MSQLSIQSFGHGNALVLFHGWGFDSQIWTPLIDSLLNLSLVQRVILVDLPGFGHSPLMAWETFKTDLLERLPQQFILAGWSLGGLFATRLAIETTDRVKHLVNIASSPYFIREPNWAGITADVLDEFYQQFQAHPQHTRTQFVRTQLPSTVQHAFEPVELSHILGLEEGLMILKEWDLRAPLETLTTPISYMFGRLDTIVPRKVMPFMQQRYPHFQYALLPDAAHIPFLSHPEQFIQTLESMIC